MGNIILDSFYKEMNLNHVKSLDKNRGLLLSDGENVAFSCGDYFVAGKVFIVDSALSIEQPTSTISTNGKPDYQIAERHIATVDLKLRFVNQYKVETIDAICTREQLATEFFMKNASIDSLLRVVYKKMEERSGEV